MFTYPITFNTPFGRSDWINPAWQHRIPITVQGSLISGTVTNFPVYVDLSTLASGFFTNVKNDGSDIRVTTDDGVTEVPVEIVSIDTSGNTGEIHFRASSLTSSTDTLFYLYYGNSGASLPASNSTYGSQNVWTQFQAVYHMQEDPGLVSSALDSTANQYHASFQGAMTSADSVAGKLAGKSIDFDGVDDFCNAGTAPNLDFTTGFQISAWVYRATTQNSVDSAIWSKNQSGGGYPGYMAYYNSNTADVYINGGIRANSSTTISANTWTKVTHRWDGSNVYVNLNGSLNTSGSFTTAPNSSGHDFRIGAYLTPANRIFTGRIDEVRVSSVHLNSDWDLTEWRNQNSPSTFYLDGAIENY